MNRRHEPQACACACALGCREKIRVRNNIIESVKLHYLLNDIEPHSWAKMYF